MCTAVAAQPPPEPPATPEVPVDATPPPPSPPPPTIPPPPAPAARPSHPPATVAKPPAFPASVASPSSAAPSPAVSFTVKPYGLLTTEFAYELGNSSNNPDVPEWAVAGPSAFYVTARQSRFGVRGSWTTPPSHLHAQKVDALLEGDFYGAFAGQGIGYFFPIPRLRLATVTIEWSAVRLSVGQDWAVLAPLIPSTALHTAVPGFTTSGNLWARIPQLRLDGAIGVGGPATSHTSRVLWTAAMVASVQADAIPTDESGFATVRIPQGGERSLIPAGEARVAFARDLFDKAFEIGVSGHLGERKIASVGGTTRQINGAVAVDVTLPLPARLSLKGEAYWGTGLDAFFGGIGQGIAHTTDATGAITSVGDSIADAGGWAQVSWAGLAWLTPYAGGGVDRPKRGDLLASTATTNRTLNAAFYGELAAELTPGFLFWLEYDFLHTETQASPTVNTHVLALTGQLAF